MPRRPVLEFWYEFASTYSYLSAMRIEEVADRAGVDVRWRPFLLGPIFAAQGWTSSPFNLFPTKGRHMWRDMEREAARLGLPFRRPDPFPQNSVLPARVALVGLAQGWGEDFSVAVYTAQFVEDGRIDEPRTLAEILSFMNVDARAALEAAQSDDIKLRLRSEVEAAQRLGVFGAPSFTTADGELFWGNDRLEQALAWAKRDG